MLDSLNHIFLMCINFVGFASLACFNFESAKGRIHFADVVAEFPEVRIVWQSIQLYAQVYDDIPSF